MFILKKILQDRPEKENNPFPKRRHKNYAINLMLTYPKQQNL